MLSTLLLIALMVHVGVGCKHSSRQTMSDLWGAVPQVRWSGGRIETPSPEEPAEPSVTANVAAAGIPKQPDPPGSVDMRSVASNATGSVGQTEIGSVQPTSALNQSTNRPDGGGVGQAAADNGSAADDVVDTTDPQSVFADTSVEQIQRLKAALDDDAERANSPPRAVAGGHDVRVRVESMLARARHLFDLGQMREARHTAKIAHDLGDSARLDYSPDEERPIDLVQRIDDHLRVTAEQAAAKQEGNADSLANQPATEPPSDESAPSMRREQRDEKGADAEGAKQRRDWGYGLTVFRRDRKPTATDRPNVAPTSAAPLPAVTSIPAVVLATPELESEPDGAVVQANRSLSLAKAEVTEPARADRQARDASAPIAFAPYQRRDVRVEQGESVPNTALDEFDSGVEEQVIEALEQEWPPEIDSRSVTVEDEAVLPPAEFEEVKPLTPFRDVAGAALTDLNEVEQIEPARGSIGWMTGAVIFGVCAAVAIFWYRRGAT